MSDLAPRVLPLLAAAAWVAIGLWPIAKSRAVSPLGRALSGFAILVGSWAATDWLFIETGLGDPSLAGSILRVEFVLVALAILALLFTLKWIVLGHSRWDALLAIPPILSTAFVMSSSIRIAFIAGDPVVTQDFMPFGVYVGQQLTYVSVGLVLAAKLAVSVRGIASGIRLRLYAGLGSLVLILVMGAALVLLDALLWFSSSLLVPAVIVIVSLSSLSDEQFSAFIRGIASLGTRIEAVYLFLRDGQPLVAATSERLYSIEAERLESILDVVGGFVETSLPSSRGIDVTGMRFDEKGVIAVRGRYLIAAALYSGPVYDIVRAELTRLLRSFEEAFPSALGSLEAAQRIAEPAAQELSKLLQPSRGVRPPTGPTGTPNSQGTL